MTPADRMRDRSRQSPDRRSPDHPPSRGISVSIRAVKPVLAYLAARRHDPLASLQAAGVDPARLSDPEARIPHRAAIAVWELAGRLSGDPDLGLHVAEALEPGAFGAIEYAVRTSQTLGAGLERLFRYHRVLHDAAEVGLTIDGERAVLSHRLPLPGGAPRPVSEFVLAGWLLSTRRATGVDWKPLQVRFPHAEPGDTAEHRRIFRAPLRFEHGRSELVLPRRLLDLPMLQADPALQSIVEREVCTIHRGLPGAESATDSVRRLLGDQLCDGEPRLERLAYELHMSPRTLNRRLLAEGTSFRRVLTDVRCELAERYLQERRLAVGEIAFLLGFSEASAFHRAFRRWTGSTPAAYRSARRAAHGAPATAR